jgi:hypothetical protein
VKTAIVVTLVTLAAAALFVLAAAGADRPTAAQAVEQTVDLINQGRFGAVYNRLHPGQRRLVPRRAWIREFADNEAWMYGGIGADIVKTWQVPIHLTGVPQRTATAVKFRVSAIVHGGEIDEGPPMVRYVVLVGNRWYWVMLNPEINRWLRKPSAATPTVYTDLGGKRTAYTDSWRSGDISVKVVHRGLLLASKGNVPVATARFWTNPVRWQIATGDVPNYQGSKVFGKLYPVRAGQHGERLTGRWIVIHDGERVGSVEGRNPIRVGLIELTHRFLPTFENGDAVAAQLEHYYNQPEKRKPNEWWRLGKVQCKYNGHSVECVGRYSVIRDQKRVEADVYYTLIKLNEDGGLLLTELVVSPQEGDDWDSAVKPGRFSLKRF